MSFISKLFSKTSDDFLAKGERLFEQERYYDARSVYEDGLRRHLNNKNGNSTDDSTSILFRTKISLANNALAELNISEAKYAVKCGDYDKAIEHLELAKALTDDGQLREMAESQITSLSEKVSTSEKINDTNRLAPSVGSCHSCTSSGPETQADAHLDTTNLSPLDYYDLLIQQLPSEMYNRYAVLGEKFAYMYLAVSNDDHKMALGLLEDWYEGNSRDIYFYEKGMILHRIGNVHQAEECLLDSISENCANPLPHFGLALILMNSERYDEAAERLDAMIADDILPEQALLLRGDVFQKVGNLDEAIRCYSLLLPTVYSKQAAEKLYDILMHCGRQQEAESVFKKYLKGCRH